VKEIRKKEDQNKYAPSIMKKNH